MNLPYHLSPCIFIEIYVSLRIRLLSRSRWSRVLLRAVYETDGVASNRFTNARCGVEQPGTPRKLPTHSWTAQSSGPHTRPIQARPAAAISAHAEANDFRKLARVTTPFVSARLSRRSIGCVSYGARFSAQLRRNLNASRLATIPLALDVRTKSRWILRPQPRRHALHSRRARLPQQKHPAALFRGDMAGGPAASARRSDPRPTDRDRS
jgi:hypothetical protein